MKQEQIRKRWKIGVAIAFPTIIAIAALLFGVQQKQSQKTIEAIFLDTDTTNILTALPQVVEQAQQHRIRVDQLSNEANIDEAIAYYNDHQQEINQAFAYYRQILRSTGRLQQKIDVSPNEFSIALSKGENLKNLAEKLEHIRQNAEYELAEIILKYRIPELKQFLIRTNPEIGELLPNTKKTDFENQYTEGALRTTYAILMRSSGAGADLNNDGLIRDKQEANQLPCDVLKQIEKLWREATEQRCGWYRPESVYEAPDCRELKANSKSITLTRSIFGLPLDYVDARFKECGNFNF